VDRHCGTAVCAAAFAEAKSFTLIAGAGTGPAQKRRLTLEFATRIPEEEFRRSTSRCRWRPPAIQMVDGDDIAHRVAAGIATWMVANRGASTVTSTIAASPLPVVAK
jgi:hypothetical protein